ncbi:UNVERIFIED_CONTAM: hypothetical protein HDU68_005454 [Siphonaria sp. JEL0065]|nr:hypothetical protein HDU68_005454 [Siphonaria sp. JEL0065]
MAGAAVPPPPDSAEVRLLLEQYEGFVDEGILHQQDENRDTVQMSVAERRQRFVQTVKAIGFIVDNRLYRLVAKGVEAYFKTRWNMRRAQSYRFVMCGSVFKALAGLDESILPHRERLCRTLKKRAMFKGPASLRAVWLASVQVAGNEEVTSTVLSAVDDAFPNLTVTQLPLDSAAVSLVKNAWENAQKRPKPKGIARGPNKKSSSSKSATEESIESYIHSHSAKSPEPMRSPSSSAPKTSAMPSYDSMSEHFERSRSNSGESTAADTTASASSSVTSSILISETPEPVTLPPQPFIFEKIQLKVPEHSALAKALEQNGVSLDMPYSFLPKIPTSYSDLVGMSLNSHAQSTLPMIGSRFDSADPLSAMSNTFSNGMEDLETLFCNNDDKSLTTDSCRITTTPIVDLDDAWMFDFSEHDHRHQQQQLPQHTQQNSLTINNCEDSDFVHLLGVSSSFI